MKKQDVYFILIIAAVLSPFFLSDSVFEFYKEFNKAHGMITSFIKFALLATLGESIGLRIQKGVYNTKGFGLIDRAIVWGILGLTIKIAFVVFYTGVPRLLEYLGLEGSVASLNVSGFEGVKLITAFSISVLINSIYAPVMMTLHKISDTHILQNNGNLKALITPIPVGKILKNLDWDTQWNFVFKKTIPFFWYPAHTITFMLPPDYQVLFAAVLGIALGLILAFANLKKK